MKLLDVLFKIVPIPNLLVLAKKIFERVIERKLDNSLFKKFY